MAYDPKRDTCATCIHFTEDPEEPGFGECKRYPPSYIQRQHLWDFAVVDAGNTCGEFTSTIDDNHDSKSKICH